MWPERNASARPRQSLKRRQGRRRENWRCARVSPTLPTVSAAEVISALQLAPLPTEGGFFRVLWQSAERDAAGRPAAGLIWFLMTTAPDGFSALHRLDAPEWWEFHAGDPVEHVQFGPTQPEPRVIRLGGSSHPGSTRRLLVPAGQWQGARLAPANATARPRVGWALLSCLMRPAWQEAGNEFGTRTALAREFPAAGDWVRALTR